MCACAEDKTHLPLVPDAELCDVRIGATDPAHFFRIELRAPCQVVLEFQEFNSAARCILLLSPVDPRPSKDTAAWKCLSPDQNKRLAILPPDPSYRVGTIYLAVRYVEQSGKTFFRLKLSLYERYQVEWYSVANRALYYGMWEGCNYHGRGRCIYGIDPKIASDTDVEWSARSLRRQCDALSCKPEFIPPLNEQEARKNTEHIGWNIFALPLDKVEIYDGEWICGKKEGFGVYQWPDRAYWGMWKAGQREGFGILSTRDGFRYEGDWLDDNKHGMGKAIYRDGTQYEGQWEDDVRSGSGVFAYKDGIVINGNWKENEINSEVVAQYPDGSTYTGQWSFHCRNGAGKERDPRNNIFEGNWEMGKVSGNGKITYANGVVCLATWEAGVRQGGTYTFPNGEVYVGDWSATELFREGYGRCTYPNGDVYEGHWHGDKKHGTGKLEQAGGCCVYDGEWCDGKRHGHGVQTNEEGVYEGEFVYDERCGKGLYHGRSGSMYKGNWKDDSRVGNGVCYDASSGTTYEGIFLFGKIQGHGRSENELETYEGAWMDGKRQGMGVTTFSNGDVLRHLWHRGARVDGTLHCDYASGDSYDGEWRGGLRCGFGSQTYADGSAYKGEWLDDRPHGRGEFTKPSGEAVEGDWLNGKQADGPGRLRFADGSVYEGTLGGGKAHGQGRLSYMDGTTFEGTFKEGIYILGGDEK